MAIVYNPNLQNQLKPTELWWRKVSVYVDWLQSVANTPPNQDLDRANETMAGLTETYKKVQQIPCSQESDRIYTYLVRGIVGLQNSCKEAQRLRDSESDYLYRQAREDLRVVMYLLQREGIQDWVI